MLIRSSSGDYLSHQHGKVVPINKDSYLNPLKELFIFCSCQKECKQAQNETGRSKCPGKNINLGVLYGFPLTVKLPTKLTSCRINACITVSYCVESLQASAHWSGVPYFNIPL